MVAMRSGFLLVSRGFAPALVGSITLMLALAGCATSRGTGPAPSTEAKPEAKPEEAKPDAKPETKPSTKPEAAPSTGQTGEASWYGEPHHGRRTASGETYDMYQLTAAHPTLPLGTRVLVTNLKNGRAVEVRINDRGPHVPGRLIDLSFAAAQQLGVASSGTIPVRIRVLSLPPQ